MPYIKLGRSNQDQSSQLDSKVNYSPVVRAASINGRVGEPFRCAFEHIKRNNVPTFYQNIEPPKKSKDEPEGELGEVDLGDADSPEFDDLDSLESDTDFDYRRSEVEDRHPDSGVVDHDPHIHCTHEKALIDPGTNTWSSACLAHANEVPNIMQNTFNLLTLFRSPPSIARTDRLREGLYETNVKRDAERAVKNTLLKSRLRRQKERGEGESLEGFDVQ